MWSVTTYCCSQGLLVFFLFSSKNERKSQKRVRVFLHQPWFSVHTYNYTTIYRETTSEQSQTLSWFIVAGEISLERQNLAHSSNGGDFQLESQQHWREENVLFSVVEAAVAAPMLTQTPAVVAADLRSNYFWYQSRSVRWLDKKLKDDARRRRKLVQHLLDIYSLGPGHKNYKKTTIWFS